MDNRPIVGRSTAEMQTDPTAEREYKIIIIVIIIIIIIIIITTQRQIANADYANSLMRR